MNQKNINLDDFKGKLLILNFWATWCAPCREEMPSLDDLQLNSKLNNLKIFPINIDQEDIDKSKSFFILDPHIAMLFLFFTMIFNYTYLA